MAHRSAGYHVLYTSADWPAFGKSCLHVIFGVVAISLTVVFDIPDQITAFVVVFPRHPLRHAPAVDNADRKLYAEFGLGCGFAAYQSIASALAPTALHLQLLPVQFADHKQAPIPAWRQRRQRQRANRVQVPGRCLATACGWLAAEYVSTGSFSCSRQESLFGLFPAIIEETDIGWIGNVSRCAGGIDNEPPSGSSSSPSVFLRSCFRCSR